MKKVEHSVLVQPRLENYTFSYKLSKTSTNSDVIINIIDDSTIFFWCGRSIERVLKLDGEKLKVYLRKGQKPAYDVKYSEKAGL